MLTPDVVKPKIFQVSGRGAYRADDVDAFFAEVSASYEQMFRENGELIKKISILANKVEQYKEEEDSLRKALISAQTLADKIVKDARDSVEGTVEKAQADADEMRAKAEGEAKEIVDKAKAEAETVILQSKKDADEILGAVNRKVMKESLEFEMLQKKASDFRASLLGLYKEHLRSINAIPEYAEKETPAQEQETPEQDKEAAVASDAPVNDDAEEAPAPSTAEPAESEETQATAESEEPAEPEEPAKAEAPEQAAPDSADSETAAAVTEEVLEDVSSDTHEAQSLFDADEDGFSLDLSALDDEEPAPAASDSAPAAPVLGYAKIEDAEESSADDNDADDDEDDDLGLFKSFFRKK